MIETIFGNRAVLRVVRVLLVAPNKFFTLTDIEKYDPIGRKSIQESLKKLLVYDFLIVDRSGNRTSYKLNQLSASGFLKIFSYESHFFQGIQPRTLKLLSDIEKDVILSFKDVFKIMLYGSLAKGKAKEHSDIDILVVIHKDDSKIMLVKDDLEEKYSEHKLQIRLMTTKEFESKLKSKDPLTTNIFFEGIDLSAYTD